MLRRLLVAVAVCLIVAPGLAQDDQTKKIEQGIGGLRGLADDQKPQAIRDLALEIRGLPGGLSKVNLANSLANLSTEGDSGHEALQAVATTLAQALKEAPLQPVDGKPGYPYVELADLVRYEHVEVSLDDPQYKAAMDAVVKLEEVRSNADFTLTDIDGKTWTRSALKGKVVLVNFWATWCPPCRKEMPDLQTLYNQYKDKGLVILAVSDESASTVKAFIAKNKYSYPILLDPGRKVNTLYGIEGIPNSYIYDRSGKLVAQSIDMRTMRQFLELLGRAGLK
ncbi:MAG TPA: TlpA disulfide reductase family protein [Fimbriimonadaceae bacterium]|nr:TlpA disulfide reductase family protein [Fimbriimonadaceae bacterium]